MHGLVFETSICYWQDQPDNRLNVSGRRIFPSVPRIQKRLASSLSPSTGKGLHNAVVPTDETKLLASANTAESGARSVRRSGRNGPTTTKGCLDWRSERSRGHDEREGNTPRLLRRTLRSAPRLYHDRSSPVAFSRVPMSVVLTWSRGSPYGGTVA